MDNQVFFNKLGNVSEIIGDVMMVCEGMDVAQGEMMNERAFHVLAAGVFGTMAYTLNAAFEKLEDLCKEFEKAHSVKYPYQMDETGKRVWATDRGRGI